MVLSYFSEVYHSCHKDIGKPTNANLSLNIMDGQSKMINKITVTCKK